MVSERWISYHICSPPERHAGLFKKKSVKQVAELSQHCAKRNLWFEADEQMLYSRFLRAVCL